MKQGFPRKIKEHTKVNGNESAEDQNLWTKLKQR